MKGVPFQKRLSRAIVFHRFFYPKKSGILAVHVVHDKPTMRPPSSSDVRRMAALIRRLSGVQR